MLHCNSNHDENNFDNDDDSDRYDDIDTIDRGMKRWRIADAICCYVPVRYKDMNCVTIVPTFVRYE